jgi:hypothetical protein
VLEELRDPYAILHVGLAAGHLGDLRGVGEDTGERVLQDIVDGPPIDSRALHRDVGDGVRGQPVAEDEQPRRRGVEGAHVLGPVPVSAGYPHAGGHRLLVDIETGAPFEHPFHRGTSVS